MTPAPAPAHTTASGATPAADLLVPPRQVGHNGSTSEKRTPWQ